jgi:hypothetical protein
MSITASHHLDPGATVTLEDPLLGLLRSLPDPAEPLKGGVRAGNEIEGLRMLAALGYAENRRGWWRKTRHGVRFLRSY